MMNKLVKYTVIRQGSVDLEIVASSYDWGHDKLVFLDQEEVVFAIFNTQNIVGIYENKTKLVLDGLYPKQEAKFTGIAATGRKVAEI